MNMNLFSTILTYAAPSANYRGESAENRSVIQKITHGRLEYALISPEAVRNALRESFRALGLPCNRTRLDDEEQLAVKFADYPDAAKYADDFFMGWLVAAGSSDRQRIRNAVGQARGNADDFTFKKDSVLRMNMAVAIEPYRHDAVFTQSPLTSADSPWQNATSSALLHRETSYTAYQYPFALNLGDCREHPDWTKALLKAVGELNNVAGNHARSYFEFAPASIVIRLTDRLVAGYSTYGFKITEDKKHSLPEIIDGLLHDDYPGQEFYLGGQIVKDMDEATIEKLKGKGVTLDRSPQRLLETVGNKAFPSS
jgi:CRISPR-associated protein Cst2